MTSLPTVTLTPTSYANWSASKDTYHLFFQILGKIKLDLMPRRNHWWQIAFVVTPRGLTSQAIQTPVGLLEIIIDLTNHQVLFETNFQTITIALQTNLTVADFYSQTQDALTELGLSVNVWTKPFETISEIPFEKDTAHHHYDPSALQTYFSNLAHVHCLLQTWQHIYKGKVSPVNNYWHSFDIATTFFSGDAGPSTADWEPVSADAYSDEVMSFGWWPGDHNYTEAAFYAYMYPDPADSQSLLLEPSSAFWTEKNGAGLALLKHDDVINTPNHAETVLTFFENFYRQGCTKMDWNTTNKHYEPRT